MSELAEKSGEGQLTVFSGIFGLGKLGMQEKEELSNLLHTYAESDQLDFSEDLNSLLAITSEVKAINNQAAILHGERIKRAQTILKKYREGAFTAWLIATYGNRQTPYNFLQYFDFYNKIPKDLHPQIEAMPRQAVYTLASRDGPLEKKQEIVKNYQGETKQQMITLIRSLFPLDENDRRRENIGDTTIKSLQRFVTTFEQSQIKMTEQQKETMHNLLSKLGSLVDVCKTVKE